MPISHALFPLSTFLCISKCITAAERALRAQRLPRQSSAVPIFWMATSRISREEYYDVYLILKIHSIWVGFCEQWKKGREMLTSQKL